MALLFAVLPAAWRMGEDAWWRAKIRALEERLAAEGAPLVFADMVTEPEPAPYPFEIDLSYEEFEYGDFEYSNPLLDHIAHLARAGGAESAWLLYDMLIEWYDLGAECEWTDTEREFIRVFSRELLAISDEIGRGLESACDLSQSVLYSTGVETDEYGSQFSTEGSLFLAQERLLAAAELAAMAGDGASAVHSLQAAACLGQSARGLPGWRGKFEGFTLRRWMWSLPRLLRWMPDLDREGKVSACLQSMNPRDGISILWRGYCVELLEAWRAGREDPFFFEGTQQEWWLEIEFADQAARSQDIDFWSQGEEERGSIGLLCRSMQVDIALAHIQLRGVAHGLTGALALAEEIEDPWADDATLRTILEPDGRLKVWSIGENRIDDGGVEGEDEWLDTVMYVGHN